MVLQQLQTLQVLWRDPPILVHRVVPVQGHMLALLLTAGVWHQLQLLRLPPLMPCLCPALVSCLLWNPFPVVMDCHLLLFWLWV